MSRSSITSYNLRGALAIEAYWRAKWAAENANEVPNPSGGLSRGFDEIAHRKPIALLNAMPYPHEGALHIGLASGFVAADIYARFMRMTGHQVLQSLAIDAFGLPAELNALETGEDPNRFVERNASEIRAQLNVLGLGQDERREIVTTDPGFCRWSQWVFLRLYESWFDEEAQRARPISELEAEFESGDRLPDCTVAGGWGSLSPEQRLSVLDRRRLLYPANSEANWCPDLGRFLAEVEISQEGRSVDGGHLIHRVSILQWSFRSTSYATRLEKDLDQLDWPDSIKEAQRKWIGLKPALKIRVAVLDSDVQLCVHSCSAEEASNCDHILIDAHDSVVDCLTLSSWPDDLSFALSHAPEFDLSDEYSDPGAALNAIRTHVDPATRRRPPGAKDESRRSAFTGAIAVHPLTKKRLPIFSVRSARSGGQVTSVFARSPNPGAHREPSASDVLGNLERTGVIQRANQTKLRDWVFARQRFWGDPVPIIHRADGSRTGVAFEDLPVQTPTIDDWSPIRNLRGATPATPLGANKHWRTTVSGDRDPNVMTQWIGSCLPHLRMLDPTSNELLVSPDVYNYWTADTKGIDTYVVGRAHATSHLLYLRCIHKALFDLNIVSTEEPVRRIVDQGRVVAADGSTLKAISRGRENCVYPVEVASEYGGDTLRVALMWIGDLGTDRKWSDDSMPAAHKFLQRVWRSIINERDGTPRVSMSSSDEATAKRVSLTGQTVRRALGEFRFRLAISEIAGLVRYLNVVTQRDGEPLAKSVAEDLVLLVSPLAPHIAEELWFRLGHDTSVFAEDFPTK